MKTKLTLPLLFVLATVQTAVAHPGIGWHIHPHPAGFGMLEQGALAALVVALAFWVLDQKQDR